MKIIELELRVQIEEKFQELNDFLASHGLVMDHHCEFFGLIREDGPHGDVVAELYDNNDIDWEIHFD